MNVPRLIVSRRRLLVGSGAVALLSACGGPAPAPVAGPTVEIEHRAGRTVVPADPQRVVTLGYSDQDPVLAVGVRPVGVTDWYGDYPYSTWPWAQDELADATPGVLNRGEFTGIPEYDLEAIAALTPDLLLGLYTGMTAEQFAQLSEIAPTVGPPAGFPEFGAPWQEYARLAGRALGRADAAERQVASVETLIADAAAAHPQFAGRTAVVAERLEPGLSFVRSPTDPRSQLLTALGFTIPAEIGELSGELDGAEISDEQMSVLDRDVLLWNTGFDPSVRPDIEAAPLYAGLGVVQAGRSVFVEDAQVSAAWTWGTVLSLPTVVDAVVAQLAAVLPG